MNDLSKSPTRKPDVPEEIRTRWQPIVDLMARVSGAHAGLIMRVSSPQIERGTTIEGRSSEKSGITLQRVCALSLQAIIYAS